MSQSDKARSFDYDLNGNVIERTDRNGDVIQYSYDKLNQVMSEHWLDGASESEVHYFDYETLGQLAYAVQGDPDDPQAELNQVTINYRKDGRIASEIQQWKEIDQELATVGYQYSGAQQGPSQVVVSYAGENQLINSYEYDLRGDVTQIDQWTPDPLASSGDRYKRVDYSRDSLGRRTVLSRSMGDSLSNLTTGPTTSYTYDQASRLSEISHEVDSTTVAEYDFAYDELYRITSIDSLVDGLTSYDYDDVGQVTDVTYAVPVPNPEDEQITGAELDSNDEMVAEQFGYDATG